MVVARMKTDDQRMRAMFVRLHIALLQRQIREQSNWYSTKRVVRRTRSGKVELSRLGNVSNRQFYFDSSVSVCGSDWTDVTSHDFD